MKKSVWAVIGIAAAVPIIWSGIEIRRSMECSGLEEDYLNTVSSLKTKVQTRSLMAQLGKPVDDFDAMMKFDEERLTAALTDIYEKCGRRAGATAARKASEFMF